MAYKITEEEALAGKTVGGRVLIEGRTEHNARVPLPAYNDEMKQITRKSSYIFLILAAVLGFFAVVGLCAFLEGCKGPPGVTWTPEQPVEFEPPPTASVEAHQVFAARCVPCHGAEGRGDGIAAQALNPRPRNFHDPAWQASITDQQIERTISQGAPREGKL